MMITQGFPIYAHWQTSAAHPQARYRYGVVVAWTDEGGGGGWPVIAPLDSGLYESSRTVSTGAVYCSTLSEARLQAESAAHRAKPAAA